MVGIIIVVVLIVMVIIVILEIIVVIVTTAIIVRTSCARPYLFWEPHVKKTNVPQLVTSPSAWPGRPGSQFYDFLTSCVTGWQ